MFLFNTSIALHVSAYLAIIRCIQIVEETAWLSVHCHNLCHYVFLILQYDIINGGFEVLLAVVMKGIIFWAVIPCSLVHSTWLIFWSWRQRKDVPLKCHWNPIRLHSITSQMTTLFISYMNVFLDSHQWF